MALGRCDSDAKVYCGICDWYKQCYSMEEIEFQLAKHLKEIHNRELLYRIEDETGKRNNIPCLSIDETPET